MILYLMQCNNNITWRFPGLLFLFLVFQTFIPDGPSTRRFVSRILRRWFSNCHLRLFRAYLSYSKTRRARHFSTQEITEIPRRRNSKRSSLRLKIKDGSDDFGPVTIYPLSICLPQKNHGK